MPSDENTRSANKLFITSSLLFHLGLYKTTCIANLSKKEKKTNKIAYSVQFIKLLFTRVSILSNKKLLKNLMEDTHVHQQEQEHQTFPSLPLILST